ncbi:unnamed protein product, partial [Prorocentrum cordatum]
RLLRCHDERLPRASRRGECRPGAPLPRRLRRPSAGTHGARGAPKGIRERRCLALECRAGFRLPARQPGGLPQPDRAVEAFPLRPRGRGGFHPDRRGAVM